MCTPSLTNRMLIVCVDLAWNYPHAKGKDNILRHQRQMAADSATFFLKELMSSVLTLTPMACSSSPCSSIKANTESAAGNTASSSEWRTESTRPATAVISSFSLCKVLQLEAKRNKM